MKKHTILKVILANEPDEKEKYVFCNPNSHPPRIYEKPCPSDSLEILAQSARKENLIKREEGDTITTIPASIIDSKTGIVYGSLSRKELHDFFSFYLKYSQQREK